MTTQPVHRYVPEWTTADRLRRVRRDAELDQAEFAKRLGLKQQRYGAWEAGRNNPPMNEFVTVAKRIELAFGVPAAWLLGLDVENPQPDGPDGGNGVRHQGLEPRTRWLSGIPGEGPVSFLIPADLDQAA